MLVWVAADVPTFDWSTILGPTGALVIALIAVGALWREDRRVYKERIDDLKASRDFNRDGWREATDANKVLAEAIAERDRADAERKRRGDRNA